jgi:uncharacterized protein
VGVIATLIQLKDLKKDSLVNAYINGGNDCLSALGYTEHGFRHVGLVSMNAKNILQRLGFPEREVELAAIAGYLHDMGNSINRHDHAKAGALLAAQILNNHGMDPKEIALIIGAIGNHDESDGQAVNNISAALILADKSDVHRSRVRNPDFATFDIHDRVNYAVERSSLVVDPQERTAVLELKIDTKICPLIEYFEIFTIRMLMSRRAAEFLKCTFALVINEVKLL